MRYGGFRPRVFFNTGLELGLWMNAVTLVAWWFWRTGQFKRLWGIPSSVILAALLVVAIMCRCHRRDFAAHLRLSRALDFPADQNEMGVVVPSVRRASFYAVRTTNLWSGESAVELAQLLVGEGRADSLDYRFENDDLLIAKALQQPIFGWGGWGRNRVYR